ILIIFSLLLAVSNTGLTRREISLTTYLNGAGVPIIAIEDPLEELAGLLNEYHYLWLVNRASGSVFKVRNALEDANLPFVHLIFGRNNGKAFAQQIAPAAFEDMHLIYASDRFAPDDTLAGQTQTILLELDYQAVRQEFALADVTRRYGSNREDSLFLYDEALRDAPPYLAGHIYTVKGNIYRASGQINAAINNYETAVKINPRNAGAHYGLALGYEKRGQRVQAIAEWEAFLRLSPTGERAQTAREHLDTLRRRR
ncbi:MAG: tetratricopeptide repeat protein, partial [Anaerolineae bacterium]